MAACHHPVLPFACGALCFVCLNWVAATAGFGLCCAGWIIGLRNLGRRACRMCPVGWSPLPFTLHIDVEGKRFEIKSVEYVPSAFEICSLCLLQLTLALHLKQMMWER